VPVLAIPDMRLVDKSRSIIEKSILDTPIRESGAYHFLYEKPYEEVIQNFLHALCNMYMDKGKSFEQPLFQLLHKVVRELTDKEFKFNEIVAIGAKFEIKVITEGNTKKPLPLQKASQGTLSVLSIFGLIYNYLKSVFPDTPEEELLKKPAIVFIDEVDAHLHPSWQQKIIGLLRDSFPNVQFIVTAHSPLVVAGCYEYEVAVLRKGKGGFSVEQFERDFIGYEAKDLYQIIFEIEEKDDTYLQYTGQGPFKEEIKSSISLLERKKKVERLYLFSLKDEKLEKELNKCIIPERLKNEFRKKNIRLSKTATITKESEEKWTITNEEKKNRYLIRKEEGKLNIYEKLFEEENRELNNKLHKLYDELFYIERTQKKFDERNQTSNLLIQNRRLKAEIEKLKEDLDMHKNN
jgi:predicted ATP-dependent endonuclease of OLD family